MLLALMAGTTMFPGFFSPMTRGIVVFLLVFFITRGLPMGMRVRRPFPVAFVPRIMMPVPAPVTVDPDISFAGINRAGFVDYGRWRLIHDNVRRF